MAVQAPRGASVVVVSGGRGVGPVGSPQEQDEVTGGHTGQTPPMRIEWVVVATGASQVVAEVTSWRGLLSGLGEARTL